MRRSCVGHVRGALCAAVPARGGDSPRFIDRSDAGRRLGEALAPHVDGATVVLGLPRGGVLVAAAAADVLGLALDILVTAKLGAPGRPELALGAVGEGGVLVVNEGIVAAAKVEPDELGARERDAAREVEARALRLRAGRPRVALSGRTAVIVDDGIATGASARAACVIARRSGASRIVAAVPVAPRGVRALLDDVADEVVCLSTPATFYAVGAFYDDFEPVSEAVVAALLADRAPR